MDGQTDRPYYRDARTHLKRCKIRNLVLKSTVKRELVVGQLRDANGRCLGEQRLDEISPEKEFFFHEMSKS